jgi:ubiquinone/menaquinone biosynthesis C-methylase UbiE
MDVNDIHSRIKQDERHWQDLQGGSLQQRAYERRGTQVMMQGQFARVASELQLKRGIRLLDLGCGAGLFLGWLGKQVETKCYGLDLSLNSLHSACVANAKVHLTLGDAELLPYKGNSFDRVLCNGAAHHLLDLRSALHEIHHVLGPGGILVMYEPNANVLTNTVRRVFLSNDKYESPADLAHKDEFTSDSVMAMLQATGFTNIKTIRCDFLAYPLSGMYMDLPLSHSRIFMKGLIGLESRLECLTFLRPIFDVFAWRILIVATKPNGCQSPIQQSNHAAQHE